MKGKTHRRTSINPQQREALLQSYATGKYPSKEVKAELVAVTGLDRKVVQVWFQTKLMLTLYAMLFVGSWSMSCDVLTAVKASSRIHRSQDGAKQPQKNAALSEIPLHLE